jgi:hypothetical protein
MIFDLSVKPSDVNDKDLEYDASSHRWMLSPSRVKSIFPWVGAADIEEKRKDVSDAVYYEAQYILSNSANWPFAEWAVNCTDAGRNAIKACLNAQAKADATSGLGSLAFQSPIEKGQIIGKKTLEDNAVNFRVDGILRSLEIEESDCSIPVFRMVDVGVRMPSSRYSDWGY